MTLPETVPLLDLAPQYDSLEEVVIEKIRQILRSKQFILGPDVEALEQELADYCHTRHALTVSSGTDALLLALMALGVGPGDEVITTTFTFFATAGSIARVGATPVFCDIDPDTFNINVRQVAAAITPRTKVLMPVHLFGQMADMNTLLDLANRHKLAIVEDAAQAIGARYQPQASDTWVPAGAAGTIGCFSFFPSKNLGGIGDGGFVTTSDPALYHKMKILRNHGAENRYYHALIGGNFRLDTIQCAVLRLKLPLLNAQHDARRQNAAYYDQHLAKWVQIPHIADRTDMIYNQYTIRTPRRDDLVRHLTDHRIGHAIYYPLPLHLQECFSHLGYQKGQLPQAEKAAAEVLSLPIFPGLTNAQSEQVCATIGQFFTGA